MIANFNINFNIKNIFAVAAVAIMALLPAAGKAQSFNVLGNFEQNGQTVAYCTAGYQQPVSGLLFGDMYCATYSDDPNMDQNGLYLETAQGLISATASQVLITKTSKGLSYAIMAADGYWYANGNNQGVPCQVTAVFTELPNGQSSANITVFEYSFATNSATSTVIYTTGNIRPAAVNEVGISME